MLLAAGGLVWFGATLLHRTRGEIDGDDAERAHQVQ